MKAHPCCLPPYTAIAACHDDGFACLVRNIHSGPGWLWRKHLTEGPNIFLRHLHKQKRVDKVG